MSAPPAEVRRLAAACAGGLAFVLAVLVLSAAIRLGADDFGANTMKALRAVHRTAASLEVAAMLAVLWFAWRLRADRPVVAFAAALTIALSVLGILAGQQPPALAAFGNLTLGLALAAAFAWLLGRTLAPNSMGRRIAHVAAALLVVQVLLGAWIAMFSETPWSLALLAHGLLGVALAAGTLWLAARIARPGPRFAAAGLALGVPAAGFASALFEQPLAAGLAHAAAAALFVSAAAYGHARIA
jgi:hypothetical protein